MNYGIRAALTALALAFTAYLAVGALLWTRPPAHPVLQISAVALYVLTTWICLFWNAPGAAPVSETAGGFGVRTVLPMWAAVLAIAVAATVPSVSWLAAHKEDLLADYATWSQGGVGALMTIVMVRRRPWAAWTGVALATVAATAWIGLTSALALGAVGAVLWVGVAQLLTALVDRAAADTARLTELQRASSEWLASQDGMRRARRTQIQRALSVAGPVLARTIATGGQLNDDERSLARMAEATLRDELRGAALLDDSVRQALADARLRGATVSVLDEGGLSDLSSEERAAVRAELAEVLEAARSDRLYVRASVHHEIAVTVVGRSGDDGDDTVELWSEIARPSGRPSDADGGTA